MTTVEFVKALNVSALVAVMLSTGLKVTVREIVDSCAHFGHILRGLAAAFILVPAATIALLHYYQSSALVSMGFLILAACPGAPMGPRFTALARGDIPLATVLMLIMGCLSAVVAPPFLALAVARLFPTGELRVDQAAITGLLLLTQLAPLAIGLAFHYRFPHRAKRLLKPVTTLGNLLLLVAMVLILTSQYETLAAIRLRGWTGMALLFAASLAAGTLCGGRRQAIRSAVVVTTCLRNAALGLVIATTNFAGTVAVTAITAYSIASVAGTLLFALMTGRLAPPASKEYSP